MTMLKITTNESEARLVNVIGQPQDAGFKLVREWPWIQGARPNTSAADVKTLIDALNSCTIRTNPKANNDSYRGRFLLSENRVLDENDAGTGDRRVSIIQTLTKVKAVTDVTSLGTPDKGAEYEILNFLGFEQGYGNYLYHIYRNLNPAQRDTVMALNPSESGYIIQNKQFKIEADKTATFYVVFKKHTWNAWSDKKGTPKVIVYNDANNYEQEVRKLWPAIKDTDFNTAVTRLLTDTFSSITDHKVQTVTVSDNNNGSVNLYRDQKKVLYQHDEYSWSDRYGTNWYAWGRNGNQCQYVAAVAAIGGLTSATDNSVHKIKNKWALYDWTISKTCYNGNAGIGIPEVSKIGLTKYQRIRAKVFNAAYNRTVNCYKDLVITYNVYVRLTFTDALDAIDGGGTGSHVESHSGVHLGYKVTNIDDSTDWIIDETFA